MENKFICYVRKGKGKRLFVISEPFATYTKMIEFAAFEKLQKENELLKRKLELAIYHLKKIKSHGNRFCDYGHSDQADDALIEIEELNE